MYNMEKIPTAKDFYLKRVFPKSFFESRDSVELDYQIDPSKQESVQIMIEFAKMHVEAALREAEYCRTKECIQKCYPLDNIK